VGTGVGAVGGRCRAHGPCTWRARGTRSAVWLAVSGAACRSSLRAVCFSPVSDAVVVGLLASRRSLVLLSSSAFLSTRHRRPAAVYSVLDTVSTNRYVWVALSVLSFKKRPRS